ncbi:MAG: NCS1 family nucleobase:cation symporter-1, partial [Candidatus Limnocylindria bacterium]
LWVGLSVCIPTYMLAAGLVDGGMNWWQAVMTIMLGNLIVLVPMVLIAHAGTRYGIPFPVLARASFGTLGSNVPAILRALVACGWFGIQTWIGGQAIHTMLTTAFPAWAGVPGGVWIAFGVFWLWNMYVVVKGSESIKVLEAWAAPFLLAAGLALLAWAMSRAGGLGPILARPSRFQTTGEFLAFFVPGLTAMVGFWATLSLNIPDFTRYAKNQADQAWGQILGLPTTMTLFAFIGIAATCAGALRFSDVLVVEAAPWDPVNLLSRFDNPVVVIVSMVALAVATLTTNIAANVVAPAIGFSNIAPRWISFRAGALITGVIGILIMPWKLIASTQGYIFTWLIGYSALLGPVAGIMIADYWIVRRTYLDTPSFYLRNGSYWYYGGWRWTTVGILVAAVLPNVPGFLAAAGLVSPDAIPAAFRALYAYAWFVG